MSDEVINSVSFPLALIESSFSATDLGTTGGAGMVPTLIGNTIGATAMAFVAALIDRFGKRPALAHLLWVLVLVKLVTPPLVTLPIAFDPSWLVTSAADSADADRMGALARSVGAADTIAFSPIPLSNASDWDSGNWLTVALLVWACGSVAMVIWILRASFRVHRLIERRGRFDITATRQLIGLAETKLRGSVRGQQEARQTVRPAKQDLPAVWLVDAIVSPMLVSPLVRRLGGEVRIVFPKALWSRLDEPARSTLLLHELEHWRRRDWIVRFIEVTTLASLWWHPLVWIAKVQIEDCEERCCDMAASTGSDHPPRIYAEAILQTLDFLCEPVQRHRCELEARPIASGVGHLPKLQHRLRQIMKPSSTVKIGSLGILSVALMLLAIPLNPEFVVRRPAQTVTEKLTIKKRIVGPGKPTVLTAGSDVEPDMIRRPASGSKPPTF